MELNIDKDTQLCKCGHLIFTHDSHDGIGHKACYLCDCKEFWVENDNGY